jgi:hypothetical protein
MTRDDLVIDMFRSSGSILLRGVSVRPPARPRSRRLRTVLKLEARRDPRVREAYEAAVARATERERVRQLRPQVLRRSCGQILDIPRERRAGSAACRAPSSSHGVWDP